MTAECQGCGIVRDNWRITESQISVGNMRHWKLQLCEDCEKQIEAVLAITIKRLPREAQP